MFVTYTGKLFDYNNITKESICIDDIFHSLSRINRFIGHSKRPYTVAEHLLRCLDMANDLEYSPRIKLLTFVHDFAEAYTGDCPTPLKDLLPEFRVIEKNVETALYEFLEIEPPTEEEHLLVKRIDNTMLVIEMRDLTLHDHTVYISDLTYMENIESGEYDIKDDLNLSEETLQLLLLQGLEVLRGELAE